ncbi:MAG: ester cyclase [Actinobacteria bacterium]|nr:ester cyclase [Actinomycetota bacterium]
MPDDLQAAREKLLLELIDAENELDFDRLVEVFPHPRYELVGTHRVYDGREQVERHLKERRGAFPDYRSELIAYYHSPSAVIAEVWMHGTHLGKIENIVPSGKGFRCRMAVFFLFDGERLTCERIYFDQATIARQLA